MVDGEGCGERLEKQGKETNDEHDTSSIRKMTGYLGQLWMEQQQYQGEDMGIDLGAYASEDNAIRASSDELRWLT